MENIRESHMQLKKGHRLILFPLPLQGHINPMIQLANILYSKGFSITIIHTNFNPLNPSNYPYFTFHSIPDGLLECEASTEDLTLLISNLNVKCVEPFRNCLAKLLLDALDEPISCLISDVVWWFTEEVAKGLKLPTIVLRTNSICSFLAFAALQLLLDKGYLPIQACRLEEPVHELHPLKVKDIPVIKTSKPEVLQETINKMAKQAKACSGIIWNSFEELERDALTTLAKDFVVPMFLIGPFHKHFPASSSSLVTQDRNCISWLDTQAPNSVLYVSFGSIAAINEAEFQEIAWGLANSKQPFLWVVRPGLVNSSEWLEPLPDGFLEMTGGRGLIVKWAPQQEVLAHPAIGGFWTHNGWNSTLEGLCEGVPMICLPNFGDQLINARYVSNVWRVGIHLENNLDRGNIESAIKRLMVEAEGQELRIRTLNLKGRVDLCLRGKGSSCQNLEHLINYILSF
ncbi:hypothetical protein P3X46_025656 [Hevea brasiliensis]|uniref:Uncharacterized protein n=1 Tax=Hevea brasiliensis TaxID=3981 RepID=A0ABQ9L828_HEVBR|nr:UDP-glycosyltransferase 76B1 [Hevea brasiliensis]KAJ9160235.1 hypothetical protein P3X46_025656 [Hevea brasiliensis]